MRYVRLTLREPEWLRHPMAAFVERSDAVRRDRLLQYNLSDEDVDYLLFHVEGDREAYEAALERTDEILSYDLTPTGPGEFYAYVANEVRDADRRFREPFRQSSLLVIPPVEYTGSGEVKLTVAGEAGDLQCLAGSLPDDLRVEVEQIGEYDGPHAAIGEGLTERQRDAVAAAVDVGYYAVPRSGSVEDVAERLDCAPSTASTHLRKAEASVMSALVDGVVGRPEAVAGE